MALNVGELYVQLNGDNKQFNKAMNTAQKTVDATARKIQDASRTAQIAFAAMGAGTVLLGKKLVQTASDIQEVQNVIDVSFGNGAKSIDKWAETTGNAMSRSTLQMKEFVGTTKSMLNGLIGNTEAGTEMSKVITQLSVDLASFRNISDERAFIALTGAITGEAESLKRLGFNVQDTQVKQFALNKGIKESYEEMDIATKTALRYELIVSLLNDVQGDSIRTQKEFANSNKRLGANFEESAGKLGDLLLPQVTKMINLTNEAIESVNRLDFEEVFGNEKIRQIGLVSAGFLGVVGAIGGIGLAIGLLTNPLTLVVAGSAAAAKAFESNFLGLRDVFTTLGNWINTIAEGVNTLARNIQKVMLDKQIKDLEKYSNILFSMSGSSATKFGALGELAGQFRSLGLFEANEELLYKMEQEIGTLGKVSAETAKEFKLAYKDAFGIIDIEYEKIFTKLEEGSKSIFNDTVDFAKDIFIDGFESIGKQILAIMKQLGVVITSELESYVMQATKTLDNTTKYAGMGGHSTSGFAGAGKVSLPFVDITRNLFTVNEAAQEYEVTLEMIDEAIENLIQEEIEAEQRLQEFVSSMSELGGEFTKLGGLIESDLLTAVGSIINELSNMQSQTGMFGENNILKDLIPGFSTFVSGISIFQSVVGLFGGSTDKQMSASEKFDKAVKEFAAPSGSTALQLSASFESNRARQSSLSSEIEDRDVGQYLQEIYEAYPGQRIDVETITRNYNQETAALERELEKVNAALESDLNTLSKALGTTSQDLANTIGSALSESTVENFGDNLNEAVYSQVKDGLIRAFLANESFEALSDTLTLALADAELDETELADIDLQLAGIEAKGKVFLQAMQDIGLISEEVAESSEETSENFEEAAESVNEMVSNLSSGISRALNESNVDTFGDNLEKTIFNSVKNGLIEAFLEKQNIEALSNTIQAAIADGVLSAEEKEDIISQYADIQKEGQDFLMMLDDVGLIFEDLGETVNTTNEEVEKLARDMEKLDSEVKTAAIRQEVSNIEAEPKMSIISDIIGKTIGFSNIEAKPPIIPAIMGGVIGFSNIEAEPPTIPSYIPDLTTPDIISNDRFKIGGDPASIIVNVGDVVDRERLVKDVENAVGTAISISKSRNTGISMNTGGGLF